MVCQCCSWWWVLGALVLYKILDRLIRIPHVLGRLKRHVFITGCDSGFGYEIAKRLDRGGVTVFAGCFTEQGEEQLRKECSDKLRTVHISVTDPESVRRAYEFVKNNLPAGTGLWGLLNNAGILGKVGPIPWMQLQDYKDTMAVNTWGLIDVTTVFLPLVKKAKGRVVNTASIAGRFSFPGSTAYCISKYGVEAFTDGLRRELHEYGATAHLIEPGFHKTKLFHQETMKKNARRVWDQLPEDIKEEYGEEFFEETQDAAFQLVDKLGSSDLSDVVDAYEHALLGMFPRARYLVGKDSNFFFMPIQRLPEWLGDGIMRAMRRKNRDKLTPAALKKSR